MGQVTWDFSRIDAPQNRRRADNRRRLRDRSANLPKKRQQGRVDVGHKESNEGIAGESADQTNRQTITALRTGQETVVEPQRLKRELDADPTEAEKIGAKTDAPRKSGTGERVETRNQSEICSRGEIAGNLRRTDQRAYAKQG